jgi:magnesium chelatase family protein
VSKYKSEPSAEIRARVAAARERQMERQGGANAELSDEQIKEHCRIDGENEALMRAAYEKFTLSARAYNKILKVARSIADLAGSPRIKYEHLAEAIQYRRSDLVNT